MDLTLSLFDMPEAKFITPTVEHLATLYVLDSLKGLGPQKAKLLFNAKIPLSAVVASPRLLAIPGKTGESLREQLKSVNESVRAECFRRAEKQLRAAEKVGGSIITYESPLYSKTVFDSNNPVPVLYARGNTELLTFQKSVACVGSRNIRAPYNELHSNFAENAVKESFTIVSGFALGADTVGHRAAERLGGKTICVMPSGLDRPFPPENQAFWEELLAGKSAVFVSEFSFGTGANSLNLRKRNKLIVAFAQGVLVSQSAVDGGAMNAHKFALEQKKPICTFADDGSEDTSGNRLIATYEKAPGTAFALNEHISERYTEWLRRL